MNRAVQTNQNAFASAMNESLADLDTFAWFVPIVLLLIAFLAWAGLQPRINEYR